MKKQLTILILTCLTFSTSKSLAQIAVKQKVDYSALDVPLNFSDTSSVSIFIIDNRVQVLDKSQEEDFVGYIRSLVGIAWPIRTKSGAPFSNELSSSIANSFTKQGLKASFFPVLISDTLGMILDKANTAGTDKAIVMTLRKWHTECYFTVWIDYDINLSIYDSNHEKLLSKDFYAAGKELGGEKESRKFKEFLPQATGKELSIIFNDTELVSAFTK